MSDREVEVLVQIGGEDVPAGRLWVHRRRGVESQTFSYLREYLSRGDAYELDPALPLVEGPQQTAAGRAIFAAFADSSPDRWGRKLIRRAERRRAELGVPCPQGLSAATFSLARTSFLFADGRKLSTTLEGSCKARGS
jgi:serine/threonine-protein kinase HipA